MSVSDNNKNRGAHGDSSFKLGGLPSSSENPPALAAGSVNPLPKDFYILPKSGIGDMHVRCLRRRKHIWIIGIVNACGSGYAMLWTDSASTTTPLTSSAPSSKYLIQNRRKYSGGD